MSTHLSQAALCWGMWTWHMPVGKTNDCSEPSQSGQAQSLGPAEGAYVHGTELAHSSWGRGVAENHVPESVVTIAEANV